MKNYLTYSDYLCWKVLKISKPIQQVIYTITITGLGSVLLALSSKITIVLPFTPVPITMQSFVVVLLSVLLGRNVMLVLFLYIFEGLLGLPVFAKGAGAGYLLGPTGGYIVGFLFAGYVCARLSEAGFCSKFIRTFFVMFVGHLIIYLFGILWLLRFVEFDVTKAFRLGVLPFIFGDVVKIVIASTGLSVGFGRLFKNMNNLNF